MGRSDYGTEHQSRRSFCDCGVYLSAAIAQTKGNRVQRLLAIAPGHSDAGGFFLKAPKRELRNRNRTPIPVFAL